MTAARTIALAAVVLAAGARIASAQPATLDPPPGTPPPVETTAGGQQVTWTIKIGPPENDEGRKLRLTWKRDTMLAGSKLLILRREVPDSYIAVAHRFVGQHQTPILAADFLYPTNPAATDAKPLDASTLATEAGTQWGEWVVIGLQEDKDGELVEEVTPGKRYVYALAPVLLLEDKPVVIAFLGEAVFSSPATPQAAWFDRSRWFFLLFVVLTGMSFLVYIQIAKRKGKEMFIRRIPGVDAIEDAVGRSTEMGRPVLYVTGIEEITDIQTIASLLILGHVAEMTAEYDTEIKVCNTYPMTMVVAEEIVRNSYTNVGRADAHRPENIMFITSEQFAFAAAVNGMILRDRPATNIYLGRFFAESLILSETGFMAGAVQIAGTAEFTQLPFFVAACDYTLIGEELYATGAYLSREPNQIAQIKAGDVMKVVVVVLILAGVIAATAQHYDLIGKFIP